MYNKMTGAPLLMLLPLLLSQFSYLKASDFDKSRCSVFDTRCLTTLMQNNMEEIITENPQLGMEDLNTMTITSAPSLDYDNMYYEWLAPVQVTGLNKTLVEIVQFNKNDKKFNFKIRIPRLNMQSLYRSSGKFRGMPFIGEGRVLFDLYGFLIDMTIDYNITKNTNGEYYITMKNYLFWFDIRDADGYFENINKDNPVLAHKVHEHYHANFVSCWEQYGRPILTSINDKIFNNVKKYFGARPLNNFIYEDILPTDYVKK